MNTFIAFIHGSFQVFCFLVLLMTLKEISFSIFRLLKRATVASWRRVSSLSTSEAVNQKVRALEDALASSVRERDLARSELASLRTQQASSPPPRGDIRKVKAAFAKLYHPDNIRSDGIERLVRSEIFKEFYGVLDRLEAGNVS